MLFLNEDIKLNETEMNIYHYINAHLDKVIYMRIRELANATYVSTTTILRFCKKFGCEGYSDFKSELRHYEKSIKEDHTFIMPLDQSAFTDFFRRFRQSEYQRRIQQAVDMIAQCDLLFFIGNGTSGVMATYASILFSSFYTYSIAITDPVNSPVYYIPDELNGHICVVAFSVSGENIDVLAYINRIRLHQVDIISITNSEDSTISKLSDLNLPYYTNVEMYQDTNITSQIPVVYIIESLSRAVYNKKHHISRE